ncbi:helix-turn-helix domain-containing protein [Ralstonia insidiosa]|uniref:Helix-turn-helix domain-containing protein n=1 Tax=Ralstonia insidiosa TaxID=190721 RepID=A0A848NWQ5_9RALS|nr:helix-turn-helix domain-containing protein [Ralstonia insidiosa]NMV36944.1 helix-turn-helix domain-containing protein [Ralstonia insidiosa]
MVQTLLAAGLTQKAIAARIGCSQPTISDLAAGKIGKSRPSYRLISGLEAMIRELPPAVKPAPSQVAA